MSRPETPGTPTDPGDRGTIPTDPGDRGTTPTDPGDRGTTPTDPGDRGTTPTDPGDRGTTTIDPGDRGTTPTDPGDRGTTTIDLLVLRKVAEHACDTTGATVPVPRSIAGRGVGALGTRGSAATVTVLGADEVAVRLDVALPRPAQVQRAAEVVRRAVEHALASTTGHHLRTLDLVVTALPTVATNGRVV